MPDPATVSVARACRLQRAYANETPVAVSETSATASQRLGEREHRRAMARRASCPTVRGEVFHMKATIKDRDHAAELFAIATPKFGLVFSEPSHGNTRTHARTHARTHGLKGTRALTVQTNRPQ